MLLARRIDDAVHLADQPLGGWQPLGFHQHQKVGARGVVAFRGQPLAGAEQRGDGRALLRDAAAAGFDDEPCEPGMQRVARHLLAQGAESAELA